MGYKGDDITLKDDGGQEYAPHPEGSFAARCVDAVDLGMKVEEWDGKEKLTHKLMLVFASDQVRDDGEPFLLSREFTASMNERAALPAFLGGWRGKSYSDDERRRGVPIGKLAGHPAYITVEHAVSKKGRTYAKILSAIPLPKGVDAPSPAYERPEWITERVTEYAAAAKAFAEQQHHDAEPESPPTDDDDDLPF